MGHRQFQAPARLVHRTPELAVARVQIHMRNRLLQALQEFFEVSRDQFGDDVQEIPEWRQADDALERAYDACAARAAMSTIRYLCAIAHRTIETAVEISTARSYYDGRL
jgi:hypothetical protein